MNTCRIIRLIVFFLILTPFVSFAASNETVYVWSFTDRSYQKDDLTDKFTNDFELALQKYGNYRIVERRQIDQLLAQAANEKTITNASQFSKDFRNALKAKSADMVVFGTVYDDKESGQYNITVTFEDFSGEKKLIKNCLIPRGKVNDAASRMEAMTNMVKSISQMTSSVIAVNSNDLLFQLDSCTISNDTIVIVFMITNNGNDATFEFKSGWNPRPKVWDNFGNTSRCDRVYIANHNDNRSVSEMLISGVPIVGKWFFSGVSPKATLIPRLDLTYYDKTMESDITVTFRNIKIER